MWYSSKVFYYELNRVFNVRYQNRLSTIKKLRCLYAEIIAIKERFYVLIYLFIFTDCHGAFKPLKSLRISSKIAK